MLDADLGLREGSRGPGSALTGGVKRAGETALAEFKYATIMFADIVGSVAAIRDSDPEEAHALLAPIIELMSSSANKYGGFVAHTLGDGIMAIFGAPMAQEDHATRACYSALDLLRRRAEQCDRQKGVDIRVGIHSGLVAVGTWQNDFANEYDATGLAVAIASRVQSAAPHGRAAITADARTLLGDEFGTRSLGLQRLKGLDTPIELFVLEEPATPRHTVAPARATFVGREEVLDALEAEFEAARSLRGRVVLVVGEAGLGKTSLVTSFFARHVINAHNARSSAERYRGDALFHPVRDLILELFGLTSTDQAARRAWIAAQSDGGKTERLQIECPLHELLDVGGLPASWEELDPKTKFRFICACIRTMLCRRSTERPLLLAIEDLQRADSATVDLLGVLSETLTDVPVLLIVTSRPEREPAWASHDLVRRIRLSPMHQGEMVDLAAHLLGQRPPQALETVLLTWSQGNPMFLKESIRGLIEARLIAREGSTLIVRDEIADIEPPISIRSVIAERVDRLPVETKEVLLTASVLGDHFSIDLLASVKAVPVSALQMHMDVLQSADFMMETSGGEFAFAHTLFQEVCYATLLKRRRRSLHAAAFTILSAALPQSVPVERLAYHAFTGEMWNDAFHYCWLAGLRAGSRSSNRDAALQLGRAAQALGSVDPDSERLVEMIDLKLALRSVLIPLLDLDRAGQLVAEAHDLARKLGDKRRLATIVGLQASQAYLTENPHACIELCGNALRLTSARADEALRIAPNVFLGQALYALGRFRHAAKVFCRTLNLIARTPANSRMGLTGKPRIVCGYWIAIANAEIGNFTLAEETARRMLDNEFDVQPFEHAYAEQALGFVLMTKGDFAPALAASQIALEIADKNDIPYMIPSLASQVGLLLAAQGDPKHGLAVARRGVEATRRIGVSSGRSRWIARLAEACLLAGYFEEAADYATEAVEIARATGEKAYLATALRLRAKVVLAQKGPLAPAETDLKEATEVARALSIRPFLAKCLVDLASVDLRNERRERARNHLLQALRQFDAFGMSRWASFVHEEMALSGL